MTQHYQPGEICPLCKYELRGIEHGQPCPECGNTFADDAVKPYTPTEPGWLIRLWNWITGKDAG